MGDQIGSSVERSGTQDWFGTQGLVPKYQLIAADAAQLYLNGHTIAQVGRRLAVYPEVVRRALGFMGVPLRPAGSQTPMREALAEQVQERYQRGDGMARIAGDLDVSVSTVNNIVGELKLPRRRNAERLHARSEEIVRRHQLGDPGTVIAADLKIGTWIVYKTLRQHRKDQ